MVPTFRRMQDFIDQINRVLREQITGIRVVRAFVREPEETERFEAANADLTDTALRGGRLMSSMFPTVNLLINAVERRRALDRAPTGWRRATSRSARWSPTSATSCRS